jgi:hypothetical protein
VGLTPDERVAEIELLSWAEQFAVLDTLAALLGQTVKPRQGRVEKKAERNGEIRRRRAEGWSWGTLAMHFKLSRSTVRDIVRRSESVCVNGAHTGDAPVG